MGGSIVTRTFALFPCFLLNNDVARQYPLYINIMATMSSRLHASQFCLKQRNFGRARWATQQRCRASGELLPIFPLGMVALPASQCPLHIFGACPSLTRHFCSISWVDFEGPRTRSQGDCVHASSQPPLYLRKDTGHSRARSRSTSSYRGTLSSAVQHAVGWGHNNRSGFGGRRQAMEGDSSVWHGVL